MGPFGPWRSPPGWVNLGERVETLSQAAHSIDPFRPRRGNVTPSTIAKALRPDTVVDELSRSVPEARAGTISVLRCRVSRIRSVPGGTGWTAVYEVDMRDEVTGVERTVVHRGVIDDGPATRSAVPDVAFGDDGWSRTFDGLRLHLDVLTTDDALRGLATIADPEEGRLLLQELLWGSGDLPAGAELTGSLPTVFTHKPGVRATVLCRLQYSGPQRGPDAVVCKVHHEAEGGRAAAALQQLAACAPSGVRLARLLGQVPELGLSVQEHIDHSSTYKDLFNIAFNDGTDAWSALLDATRLTAAGLAGVHTSGCAFGEPVRWEDELAVLRAKQARLAGAMPTVDDDGRSAIPDRLAAAAATSVPDALGPAHHSFRAAQVLVTDRGVAFIDLDKLCQAEPASDIAAFLTKLRHTAVNKVAAEGSGRTSGAKLDALRTVFLEEYRRHCPVSEERLALWEALELAALVLSAAKHVNQTWVETCHRMLEEHLAGCGW
jgi:hypothetical protein